MCKRKLESKKEALLILSKELDTCQQERDQYKLMANQLRERHQGLKKKYRELIVSGSKFQGDVMCPHAQNLSFISTIRCCSQCMMEHDNYIR